MGLDKDRLDYIIRVELGINPEDEVISLEFIEPKHDRERFERVRDEYRQNLQAHPNRESVAKRLYVGDDLIVYVRGRYPRSVLAEIDEDHSMYYPFCSIGEIKRIQNIQNAEDYLLKLRADAIANNPRFVRIFLSRHQKEPGSWSLSSHYENAAFSKYLARLTSDKATLCQQIPAGFAYLKEPNGACIRSPFGDLIVLSEALEYFLFYMNLFIFSDEWGLPDKDAFVAFIIASKTMLRTEPLDFDLDPRGHLPKKVVRKCWALVRTQIEFIVGHEYAHLILGHLNGKVVEFNALEMLGVEVATALSSKYYTPRQNQEFEADVGSVLNTNYTDAESARSIDAAAIFFIGLDLFYAVDDFINPPMNGVKTHPDPLDRLWNLRKVVHESRPGSRSHGWNDEDLTDAIEHFGSFKKFLVQNYLPREIELFEDFKSIYLPSYHRHKLYDRFDY